MEPKTRDALLTILLMVPLFIFRAWVLTLTWGWFAVPLGAPAIGKAHAWGLTALVYMFVTSGHKSAAKDEWSALYTLCYSLGLTLLGLLSAYIAHLLM